MNCKCENYCGRLLWKIVETVSDTTQGGWSLLEDIQLYTTRVGVGERHKLLWCLVVIPSHSD